jgi:glucosamine 6-phosphate synthetase-like amidotransferase/phosphosugar isomerase protein
MCGQFGIILARKLRRKSELKSIERILSRLAVSNEDRGTDATGLILTNSDGSYFLYKNNISARKYVKGGGVSDVLSHYSNKTTTAILGHTRWANRGTPENSRNNHPLVCGDALGTHNGTITNAKAIAARFGIDKKAEVDSEIIFRLADLCHNVDDGNLDVELFREFYLSKLAGQMSAVVASRSDGNKIVIVKGNKPLAIRYSKKLRAIIYSSESLHVDAAIVGEVSDAITLSSPKMSVFEFFTNGPQIKQRRTDFDFHAQERGTGFVSESKGNSRKTAPRFSQSKLDRYFDKSPSGWRYKNSS